MHKHDLVLRSQALAKIVDTRIHCVLFLVSCGRRSFARNIALCKSLFTHCNVIPIVSIADTVEPLYLPILKQLIMDKAIELKFNFFNCVQCCDNGFKIVLKENSCPPFAVMTPNEMRRGVAGRENIDGVFIDANKFDFRVLVETVFNKLPESLVLTTDLQTQDFISSYDRQT